MKPLLIGNNFAILVAAAELARRRRPFTLLSDGKAPGGHFAGMQVDGEDFDIGMVMLEKAAAAVPCDDLRQYNPAKRNDWTRFGHLAAAWLESQLALRRTPTPECLVDGRVWPDHLIANRLDVFAAQRPEAPPALPCGDQRHAMHKSDGAAYEHLSYAEAAQANHGAALHAHYIEPFLRKLLGVPSQNLLARYHRAAWVPLYYPETLRAAIEDRPFNLPEYPFWTTSSGSVGAMVRQLRDSLAASPMASVESAALVSLQTAHSGITATLAGGQTCSASSVALGLAAERCHALLGLPPLIAAPAASVTLAFCRVRADAIGRAVGCLMVVDEEHAAYRLTDQDTLAGLQPQWHRVTIEASPERLAQHHPGIATELALEQELRALMQVRGNAAVQVLKCITARNALTLPDAAAVGAADAAHRNLHAHLPGTHLSGGLLGFGVASLNDQLVQGLRIAEELS